MCESGKGGDDRGDLVREDRLGAVVQIRRAADHDEGVVADDEEVRVVRKP